MNAIPSEQHNVEIQQNLLRWQRKPLLRAVYQRFYATITQHIRRDVSGVIVELGSGIGNLKSAVPDCICTDLFPNPWIDQQENAYALSFDEASVSNLILFDVWHHLEFPGTALKEFRRVLAPGGRVIILDPAISGLGWLVYGALHHEPVGWRHRITWEAPDGFDPRNTRYYAAQGNATRVFCSEEFAGLLSDWKRVAQGKISAISYVASGGYRGPQLYPGRLLPLLEKIDRVCDRFPALFATRLLVVLERAADDQERAIHGASTLD